MESGPKLAQGHGLIVKEIVMHMMGRIGFMGLGIALVGCLGGETWNERTPA
jgi:hypothetical protein